MEEEDALGNPTIGHIVFLVEAYQVCERLLNKQCLDNKEVL